MSPVDLANSTTLYCSNSVSFSLSIVTIVTICIFMKPFYQSELKDIRGHIVLMGEKCIEIVRAALQALEEHNPELAHKVRDMDNDIDDLELQIDAEAARYFTLRSPVAKDVRLLTLAMKSSHDLERIGDEATSIAKRVIKMSSNAPVKNRKYVDKMGLLVLEQLGNALDCFINGNAEKAYGVPKSDKVIDDLNRDNYAYFTESARENTDTLQQYIEMIFVSKSLERIGDHATNIAEEVIYLVEGDDIRHTDATKRTGMTSQ